MLRFFIGGGYIAEDVTAYLKQAKPASFLRNEEHVVVGSENECLDLVVQWVREGFQLVSNAFDPHDFCGSTAYATSSGGVKVKFEAKEHSKVVALSNLDERERPMAFELIDNHRTLRMCQKKATNMPAVAHALLHPEDANRVGTVENPSVASYRLDLLKLLRAIYIILNMTMMSLWPFTKAVKAFEKQETYGEIFANLNSEGRKQAFYRTWRRRLCQNSTEFFSGVIPPKTAWKECVRRLNVQLKGKRVMKFHLIKALDHSKFDQHLNMWACLKVIDDGTFRRSLEESQFFSDHPELHTMIPEYSCVVRAYFLWLATTGACWKMSSRDSDAFGMMIIGMESGHSFTSLVDSLVNHCVNLAMQRLFERISSSCSTTTPFEVFAEALGPIPVACSLFSCL